MNHESQLLGYFAMLMMSAPSVNWQKYLLHKLGFPFECLQRGILTEPGSQDLHPLVLSRIFI